jgi:hypothetical protein
VKLGKNASNTCAMLPEAYGGEDMKISSVSDWHKRFKLDRKTWKVMKEIVGKDLNRTNEKLEKLWNLVHSDRHLNIRVMVVYLNLERKAVGKA